MLRTTAQGARTSALIICQARGVVTAADVIPKMGRARRGMYGGKEVMFGNRVSHSQRKTRRRWNPNVQQVALFSEILGKAVRMPVTTHVLRTIDKYGGLDNYLLNQSSRKLAADPFALTQREQLLHAQAARLPRDVSPQLVRQLQADLVSRYGGTRSL